jgi:hypothetical protein
MLFMEIFQCGRHLCNILRGFPLWKPILFPEVFVQLTFTSKFEDQKDPLAVMEMTVQAQHIRMPQVALYLNLSPDLLLDASLLQFRFVENLERADETRRPLFSQVDSPKFPLAKGLSNLEHPKLQFL